MKELTLIYIEDSKDYFIGSDGYVYNQTGGSFSKIQGWLNSFKHQNKLYRRSWIFYKDGTKRQLYNHYLVAVAFHGGDKRNEGKLVRHGELGHQNNEKDNISWGTHRENMVDDRKRDGNYHKRGVQNGYPILDPDKDDCPF